MRTFRIKGFSLTLVPILVIAFAVKSAAFEGESDILGQALRPKPEELVGVLKKGLQSLGDVEVNLILPVRGTPKEEAANPYLRYLDLMENSLAWAKDNPDKKILGIFIVGSAVFGNQEKELPDQKTPNPVGTLVFFIRKGG